MQLSGFLEIKLLVIGGGSHEVPELAGETEEADGGLEESSGGMEVVKLEGVGPDLPSGVGDLGFEAAEGGLEGGDSRAEGEEGGIGGGEG